jgi:hypothetical protein
MRRILTLGTAFVLSMFWMAAPALAQDPPPAQQQQAEEADEKAEVPDYAGKWTVSMESPQGAFVSTVDIAIDKDDSKTVTGSMASEMGTFEVWGEIDEGMLWFAISPDGSMELWFGGTMKEDGTMAGTMEIQGTSMTWTGKRVKK